MASSSDTILLGAYEEAVSAFRRELGQDDRKLAWLQSRQSIEDVRQAIVDAQTKYQTKPKSKAHKWLGILSTKVMFYAPVLDVLSQAGQQYGSLAWGVIKFLFVVRML